MTAIHDHTIFDKNKIKLEEDLRNEHGNIYYFVSNYDLSGKTVMPFATSGGSGIETSVSAIRSICPNADVKDGLRGSASTTSTQMKEWIGL